MRSMNVDESLLTQPGVSVIGHPRRAENHVTAGYTMGEHLVVTCDPEVETMLIEATRDMAPTFNAWRQVAASAGGELLGSSRIQILSAGLPQVPGLPDALRFRRIDTTNADDLKLVEDLVERSDAADLDEAEIELGNLDEIIDVILDTSGDIVTYSSACPFAMAIGYGDIGIFTRPEYQGQGLGSLAVAAMCERLQTEGLVPLYRCGEDNVGSIKVSAGLGFQVATKLTSYRFPHNMT
jgi:GNAT superfamily N-acetyltransferase